MSPIGAGRSGRRRKTLALDPWLLVAFFIPFTALIDVDIGGKLYLCDVVGVVLLLVLANDSTALVRLRQIALLLTLLCLWLLSQIVTDIYRASVFADYSRGWMKIILFGVQIASLWLLLPRRRSYIVAHMLGFGLTLVWSTRFLEPAMQAVAWKFGLASGTGFIAAALVCGWIPGTRALRPYSGLILLAVAALFLVQGARNSFGVMAMTAVFVLVAMALERTPAVRAGVNRLSFTLIALGGLLAALAVTEVYGHLAASGSLGEAAEQKYRLQASGDAGVLIGGRVESLASLPAIADSPVLGHGSWARDIRYALLLRARMDELGIPHLDDPGGLDDLIPTHSHLLGAWVEAGLMGGVFWAYVIGCIVAMAYRLLIRPEPLMPLAALAALSLLWSILFSPFGANARFIAASSIVVILWVLRQPLGARRSGHSGAAHLCIGSGNRHSPRR